MSNGPLEEPTPSPCSHSGSRRYGCGGKSTSMGTSRLAMKSIPPAKPLAVSQVSTVCSLQRSRHRVEGQFAKSRLQPLPRLLEPDLIVRAGMKRGPLPEVALHPIPALDHVLESSGARFGRAAAEPRRVRGAEVAGARDFDESSDETGEVQTDFGRTDKVRAVLPQAGKAVDLEDVEVALVVESHVDARAVGAPQRREGADGDLLRVQSQLLADGGGADGGDLPATAAGLVLVGVDGRALGPEIELHRRKRLRRVVAEEADVDLPALDVLLGEHALAELVEDHARRPRGALPRRGPP